MENLMAHETIEDVSIDISNIVPLNNLTLLNLRKPIIYQGENCFRFLKITTIPESGGDVYYRVRSLTEGRPDLLSYIFYGTPYLKEFILLANDIIDPFYIIPIGSLIRIPHTLTLFNMLKNLKEVIR